MMESPESQESQGEESQDPGLAEAPAGVPPAEGGESGLDEQSGEESSEESSEQSA